MDIVESLHPICEYLASSHEQVYIQVFGAHNDVLYVCVANTMLVKLCGNTTKFIIANLSIRKLESSLAQMKIQAYGSKALQ